jgi:Xaa-Pro aminopeptidase
MRYQAIESSFYQKNRKFFAEKMDKNSMAIFTANTVFRASADGEVGFRQNSSFFYLTGIDQEECKLIILKTFDGVEEFLFVAETNEKIRIWDGDKLSIQQASALSGINQILYLDKFDEKIKYLGNNLNKIYCHVDLSHQRDKIIQTQEKQLYNRIRRNFNGLKFKNPALWINEQRVVKDSREIVQIKKAIEISKMAFNHFSNSLTEGVFEYQMEAELQYQMSKLGSRYPAFQSIVASGTNACVLHYIKNDSICKKEQMVLLDFGAEYGGYNADITRVLPVSGYFTDRQAEVYTAVLDVFKHLRKYIKPGEKLAEIKAEARYETGKKLMNLKLISNITDENISKYFPHGPSHFLGLDVHDVGERSVVLQENMLITCEPGIYIPEEGIGIRLENDLLISKNGNVDLCLDIPIEINDIVKK